MNAGPHPGPRAAGQTVVELTPSRIDVSALMTSVAHPSAGGTAIFVGTTRDHSRGRRVLHLEYEAYGPMAENMLRDLAAEIDTRWPVLGLAIVHRVGRVEVGDASVVIAVSTAHRAEAFDACRYAIDTLKNTIPIWKKEVFEDGEEWARGPEKIEPDAFTRRAFP